LRDWIEKAIHDLGQQLYLLDLLEDVIPLDSEIYESIIKLNAFGIEIRYPDIKIELTTKDREEAMQIAKVFREFHKSNLDFDIQ